MNTTKPYVEFKVYPSLGGDYIEVRLSGERIGKIHNRGEDEFRDFVWSPRIVGEYEVEETPFVAMVEIVKVLSEVVARGKIRDESVYGKQTMPQAAQQLANKYGELLLVAWCGSASIRYAITVRELFAEGIEHSDVSYRADYQNGLWAISDDDWHEQSYQMITDTNDPALIGVTHHFNAAGFAVAG